MNTAIRYGTTTRTAIPRRQLAMLCLLMALPPTLAASGLTLPLPGVVYRLAVTIVESTEVIAARIVGAPVTETAAAPKDGTIRLTRVEIAEARQAPSQRAGGPSVLNAATTVKSASPKAKRQPATRRASSAEPLRAVVVRPGSGQTAERVTPSPPSPAPAPAPAPTPATADDHPVAQQAPEQEAPTPKPSAHPEPASAPISATAPVTEAVAKVSERPLGATSDSASSTTTTVDTTTAAATGTAGAGAATDGTVAGTTSSSGTSGSSGSSSSGSGSSGSGNPSGGGGSG